MYSYTGGMYKNNTLHRHPLDLYNQREIPRPAKPSQTYSERFF